MLLDRTSAVDDTSVPRGASPCPNVYMEWESQSWIVIPLLELQEKNNALNQLVNYLCH